MELKSSYDVIKSRDEVVKVDSTQKEVSLASKFKHAAYMKGV